MILEGSLDGMIMYWLVGLDIIFRWKCLNLSKSLIILFMLEIGSETYLLLESKDRKLVITVRLKSNVL